MELEEIRVRIDETDRQIVELFARRMNLVKDVAEYKLNHDMPVLRADRENLILDKVAAQVGPEYGDYARDLYTHVMRISRQMQQEIIDSKK